MVRRGVIETSPAALQFRVTASGAWNEALTRRVRKYFHTHGLASLYASEAADELVNSRYGLGLSHSSGGRNAVHDELATAATSAAQASEWLVSRLLSGLVQQRVVLRRRIP